MKPRDEICCRWTNKIANFVLNARCFDARARSQDRRGPALNSTESCSLRASRWSCQSMLLSINRLIKLALAAKCSNQYLYQLNLGLLQCVLARP